MAVSKSTWELNKKIHDLEAQLALALQCADEYDEKAQKLEAENQSQMELHQKIIEGLNRRIAEANNILDHVSVEGDITYHCYTRLRVALSAPFPTSGKEAKI